MKQHKEDSRGEESSRGSDLGKKNRGMKSRSDRNRKRPGAKAQALEDVVNRTHVHRLAIDGKIINDSTTIWLRTVEPYPYTFSTFPKARWLGRTVLDVYTTEFGSYPNCYYESAISQGRILVSNRKVDIFYIIKDGDLLTHTVHRHEPAVAVFSEHAPYIRIVLETDDVIVVDKPGTVATHPCGGYNAQSLMSILELHYGKVYTIHRLDRLTSGLVILGKTPTIAREWGKAIMDRNCKKAYLARVAGKFPLNCSKDLFLKGMIRAPVNGEWVDVEEEGCCARQLEERRRNSHGWWVEDGYGAILEQVQLDDIFECQQNEDEWLRPFATSEADLLWFHLACPTRVARPRDAVCEAGTFETLDDSLYRKTVKSAETSFGVVRYDEATDSTIVVCRPATGRSHQIRLHLQYVGHPIANDPKYGGDIWYGNEEGQEACTMAQQKLEALQSGMSDDCQSPSISDATNLVDVPATKEEEIHSSRGVSNATIQGECETLHDFVRRTCVLCARSSASGVGTDRSTLEFLIQSSGIWLHAFQYTFFCFEDSSTTSIDGLTKRFRAPLPPWYYS
eukprot:scaffold22733_cov214-Cylindrotheca_fusiformis.AAC.2